MSLYASEPSGSLPDAACISHQFSVIQSPDDSSTQLSFHSPLSSPERNPKPLSWPPAPECEFPHAIALLTGRYLLPSQRTSGNFRLPPSFEIVLSAPEQSALVFACQSHNCMAAHSQTLRQRYEDALRVAINLKKETERADATCRDTQHHLEMWIDVVFRKLRTSAVVVDGSFELQYALDDFSWQMQNEQTPLTHESARFHSFSDGLLCGDLLEKCAIRCSSFDHTNMMYLPINSVLS